MSIVTARWRAVLVLGLLAGAAGLVPANAAPQRITYRFAADKSATYKVKATIKGSLPLLDNPDPVQLDALLWLTFRSTPKAVLTDGAADVEVTVEAADAEVANIPMPVPLEQAQKLMNKTVTLAATGEVKKASTVKEMPFALSIPGIDPSRLYALLFPVVFPSTPVAPGAEWEYHSELIGGGENPAKFTARIPKPDQSGSAKPLGQDVRNEFTMTVNQKLDERGKPVADGSAPYKTRKGKIQGKGTYEFDMNSGRLLKGTVDIAADLVEEIVGKPLSPDTPTRVPTTIRAQVVVQLQPASRPGNQGQSNTTAKERQ